MYFHAYAYDFPACAATSGEPTARVDAEPCLVPSEVNLPLSEEPASPNTVECDIVLEVIRQISLSEYYYIYCMLLM